MKGMNKKNILAIVLIFSSLLLLATTEFPPWDVPADEAEKQSPIEIDKKVLEAGKTLYKMNCSACHGPQAKGDGAIPSGDLTSKRFDDQSDGAVYYKLQTGRGLMPSFKALPENDLWSIIAYLRSLSEPADDIIRKNATMILEFGETDSSKTVTAKVYEILENGHQTPAKEVKVSFYVKRYFADMLIGGSQNYTNADGTISVSFPDGMPGEDGKLQVIVKVEDGEYNLIEETKEMAWGVQKETYWNNDRQLWKNNDFVPIWLLALYIGITGGVLLAIGYALMLVFKIWKLGSQ